MDIHEALNIVAKSLPLSSPAVVSGAWQTLKSAVLAQRSDNSAMVPCEHCSPGFRCQVCREWGYCNSSPCMVARHQ
jgi:hypothetical protein